MVLAAAALAGWWRFAPRDAVPAPEISLIPESAFGTSLSVAGCLALSPDGSQLAFITHVDGRRMLAIAPSTPVATSGEERPGGVRIVPGSEEARHPSWSTDSTRIAFATYERGPLNVVDLGSSRISRVGTAGYAT